MCNDVDGFQQVKLPAVSKHPECTMTPALDALSSICGWLYFLAWSISFYPQPLLNWRQGSTHGLTIDYPLLNVLGFACYSANISALLYSPVIRAQYAARHEASPTPTARVADLAFASHAGILSIITLSQFSRRLWGWRSKQVSSKSKGQSSARPTLLTICLFMAAVLFIASSVTVVLVYQQKIWQWLDLITSLSILKVVVTFAKYVPQAFSHWQRKSTKGFSIVQVLLDLTGGIFSLAQLMIDSAGGETGVQSMFSAMSQNPGKLGLAGVSMFFDGIFIVQHYVLYGSVEDDVSSKSHGDEDDDSAAKDVEHHDGERQPLLRPRQS